MSTSTPRRFPIRVKLILAFAVPVAILLVVTVSQILQVRKEARRASEQAELALTVEGPGSLFDALHDERAATYYDLINFDAVDVVDFPVYMDEARVITDESVAGFEDLLDGQSSRMRDLYDPALDALATLDDIRAEADAYTGPRDFEPEDFDVGRELFESYTAVIDELIDATFEVTLSIEDPELQAGAELTRLASRQADIISQITTYLIASLVNDDIIGTHTVDLAGLQGELNTNESRARSTAVGPYEDFVEHIDAGVDVPLFNEIVRDTIESGEYDVATAMEQRAEPEEWSYGNLRDDVAVVLQEQADELETEAADRERLYLALGLLGPLLTAVVTWLLSWSITRPLRSLTHQATAMADDQLPAAVQHVLDTPPGQDVEVPQVDPVTVMTNDEVSDVAQALNTAQDSSLNLAVEQALLKRNIADSFVNLGQRNQQLLSRQLDFITELERNETDPNTLANLFRLDHLATRMRRNAESLLVLAGVDPPRKWAVPVSLADVIRAALSEVEDYQRVVVHDNSSVSVVGSAAADLTHLLAELLENALAFSLPIRSVEVHGGRSRLTPEGAPAGYTLAIVDSGRGMNTDEIDRANRRLAGTEGFTVAPSRFLGHYVVGAIAARHDIAIQLHSNPNVGITATVTLPSPLLINGQGEIQAGAVPQR